MLSSIGIQSPSKIHPSNPLLTRNSPQNHISTIPKTLSLSLISPTKLKPKSIKVSASSASSRTQEESIPEDKHVINREKKKRVVVVKPLERQRLVLKFIWMEKNIGIALDQVIPGGHGTIPLSPYYYWPRRDAWEELKVMLESKQWISEKQIIVLLNQATEIINLWQATGGGDLD